MIDLLGPQFDRWAADDDIALILLEAAGEKAFSAGADLHRMHKTMLEHHASPERGHPRQRVCGGFFGREYRLDYRIHTCPKPVLCWGHGIVMGGGVGFMSGASHRVVTPESRVAMPEITIGFCRMSGAAGCWAGCRAALACSSG